MEVAGDALRRLGITRQPSQSGINLRTYQEDALKQLGTENVQVLSITPGGGKTYTAIEYMIRNKFKRTLILAHGQNVLKTQWTKDFDELELKYSTDINSDSPVVITIPQSIIDKKIPKFDLLIVDEAHEFYFAKEMMPKITEQADPTCTLLLTGTPSKLIHHGLKPVIISGVEVYNADFLSDAYCGLVKSTYKLSQDYFNDNDELKTDVIFEDVDTESSLNELVKEMLNRLKTVKLIKNKPNMVNATTYAKAFSLAFGTLGKTLIAANGREQALAIHKALIKNGINAVVSECKTDEDAKEIEKFKKNKDIQVLVVVRRGILGFNMPELANVVDFTMSRNIDRIYQLFARVLRKNGDQQKFYFRMCSAIYPDLDTIAVSAAMCLSNKDFISKYNGRNLNVMEMPLARKHIERLEKHNKTVGKSKKARLPMDAMMIEEVMSLGLMSEMAINANSEYWKEFGFIQYGDAIGKLTGKTFENPRGNKQKILDLAKSGMQRPHCKITKLGQCLYKYVTKSQKSYDPEFDKLIRRLRPDWFTDRIASLKEKSYKKMLMIMPPNVSFKEGQEWNGVEAKYIFIDKDLGEFTATAHQLIYITWPGGNSGHPKNKSISAIKTHSKPVLNLETGEIFKSSTEAAKCIGVNSSSLNEAIQRQAKCKGYKFVRYDKKD